MCPRVPESASVLKPSWPRHAVAGELFQLGRPASESLAVRTSSYPRSGRRLMDGNSHATPCVSQHTWNALRAVPRGINETTASCPKTLRNGRGIRYPPPPARPSSRSHREAADFRDQGTSMATCEQKRKQNQKPQLRLQVGAHQGERDSPHGSARGPLKVPHGSPALGSLMLAPPPLRRQRRSPRNPGAGATLPPNSPLVPFAPRSTGPRTSGRPPI